MSGIEPVWVTCKARPRVPSKTSMFMHLFTLQQSHEVTTIVLGLKVENVEKDSPILTTQQAAWLQ